MRQVVDRPFERLDLRRQLAGRGAVAAVLDLEQGIGLAELIDFGRALQRAPRPMSTGSVSAPATIAAVAQRESSSGG